MSDAESETEDGIENPSPESDLQAEGATGAQVESEHDEAYAVGHVNTVSVDTGNQNQSNSIIEANGLTESETDIAGNKDQQENVFVEGKIDVEDNFVGINRDDIAEDEINPAELLAEGDQYQRVGAEEIGTSAEYTGDVNPDNLVAEDEQYIVPDVSGVDSLLQPESDIQYGEDVDGAAGIAGTEDRENSNYRTVRSTERTESSSQLECYVNEYDASSDNTSQQRKQVQQVLNEHRYNMESSEAEGAAGEDTCLAPESELGESAMNSGTEVAVSEKEPTESDQEMLDSCGVANNLEQSSVAIPVNTADTLGGASASQSDIDGANINDTSNPGPCLVSNNVNGTDNVSVCDVEQGVPEDEISGETVRVLNTATECYQPECDQSELKACNDSSSHGSVGACFSSSALQSVSASSDLQINGNSTDCVVTKSPNDTIENSVDHTKISLSNQNINNENGGENRATGTDSDTCSKAPHEVTSNFVETKDKGAIPKRMNANVNPPVSAVPSSKCDKNLGDSEDELLSELDATLTNSSDPTNDKSNHKAKQPQNSTNDCSAIDSKPESVTNDTNKLSCDQCIQNNVSCSLASRDQTHSKGDHSGTHGKKESKGQLYQANQLLIDRECEISRLKEDIADYRVRCETLTAERDADRLELERLSEHNSDDLYIPQIKELEYTIAQQQNEVRGLKEKLSSHDASAKRAIATLQAEMKLRIEQIQKQCEEATREKDSMVMKYAQAEQKNLDRQRAAERAEGKLRDMEKERGSFLDKMRVVKEHRNKVAAELEVKHSEVSSLHKELDKQKELATSAEIRVKWAQNKLKAELEAHKETKLALEKANVKIREAKEETQQIRKDCQAIIKTYQESEEVKSNSLDKELKQKESELLENQMQKTNFELAQVKTQRELEAVRGDFQESQSKLSALKEKLSTIEGQKEKADHTVSQYGEIIQKQKKEIQELRDRVESLVQYKTDFTSAQEMIKTLDSEISELKIANKELVTDMDSCRRRETDKLELTAKLSRKNAELQSDNTTLSNKVLTLTGELQAIKMENQDGDTKLKEVSDALAAEQKLRQEESQAFNTKLAGKCKAVEDLTRKVEDEKDEIKTLKRKHANNIKDMTRQLQQARRKLENYEVSSSATNSNGDRDTVSLGSRTSSNGSLNTIGLAEQTVAHVVQPGHGGTNSVHRQPSPEQEYPVITEQVEVDKHTLIERIVKLQKNLARKNDKIEFMEDHVTGLVDEIQKKNRIIQTYFMKEEAGTMTSNLRDQSKAEISRKHSIMGSVYSSHSTDGTMTLDLSLEINKKLQAVLEDTLLKNMTLKESLDTLGQEIARLSQENRKLQLSMQSGKSHPRGNPSHR